MPSPARNYDGTPCPECGEDYTVEIGPVEDMAGGPAVPMMCGDCGFGTETSWFVWPTPIGGLGGREIARHLLEWPLLTRVTGLR